MLVSNTLPATKTRTDWHFAYLPVPDATTHADGKLVITEEQGKRVKRTISASYGVQCETPKSGHRCFLLLKADHAGNLDTAAGKASAIRCGEVYEVVLNGSRSTCTCPGFALGKRCCKHMIAMLSLVESGGIE